jgi:hypothetical protein
MEYRSTTIKVREGGKEREEIRMVMVRKNGGCCEVEDVLAAPIRNGWCRSPHYELLSHVKGHTKHIIGNVKQWSNRFYVHFAM